MLVALRGLVPGCTCGYMTRHQCARTMDSTGTYPAGKRWDWAADRAAAVQPEVYRDQGMWDHLESSTKNPGVILSDKAD